MRVSVSAGLAFVMFCGAAQATPVSVSEAFDIFNAVVEGDMVSSQEVEGRLYVGGNLSGNTIQVGFKGVTNSSFDELVVAGDVTIGTVNMQNGSDMTVGGSVSSNVNMNAGSQGAQTARIGGTQTSGTFNIGTRLENQTANDPGFASRFPDIDFQRFIDESDYLKSLGGSAVDLSDQNNRNIFGSDTAEDLTVVKVDLANLNGGIIRIDNRASKVLLINVAGTSGTFAGNIAGGTGAAENVIWNFYEATDVNVNTAIIGSVLAPRAHMRGFGGSTEGSVIARRIDLTNGELHSRTFDQLFPEDPNDAPPTIPVPASLPLLAGGVALLAAVRRRAKAAA